MIDDASGPPGPERERLKELFLSKYRSLSGKHVSHVIELPELAAMLETFKEILDIKPEDLNG